MNIIITTKEDLADVMHEVLKKHDAEKEAMQAVKLYTINQVAKLLGRAHRTISNAAKNGLIHTTKDGLIPEYAIEEYLNRKS
jgi:ribosomal protein S20